jgi:hypothetical protein
MTVPVDRSTTRASETAYPAIVGASRWVGAIGGALVIAGATIAMLGACKSGDYDGSFDGSIDGGPSAEGSTASRMVQPDKTETVASGDGVIDVTFGGTSHANIQGQHLIFSPVVHPGSIEWVCNRSNTLSEKYVPPVCRH